MAYANIRPDFKLTVVVKVVENVPRSTGKSVCMESHAFLRLNGFFRPLTVHKQWHMLITFRFS